MTTATAKAVTKAAAKTDAKTSSKTGAKPAAKAKAADGAPKAPRKPNAAFAKPLTPTAPLAAVIGAEPLARTAATSKIWDYIKSNNLQNPKNKREIVADDKLKAVFGGKDRVTMFELTKHVSDNLKAA